MKCERCGLRRGRWWHDTWGWLCGSCRYDIMMLLAAAKSDFVRRFKVPREITNGD